MRYKDYTITVTVPPNAARRGCTDPIFTIIRGGMFGAVQYQETIHASFGSIAKGRAAAIAAAKKWIDANAVHPRLEHSATFDFTVRRHPS